MINISFKYFKQLNEQFYLQSDRSHKLFMNKMETKYNEIV